ncbi:MAG: DUF4032 domain-containing protein [Elusimicrobiota bacterium]
MVIELIERIVMPGRQKDTLIDFDSIEKNLEHVHQLNLGVKQIPIDKIVGSLGRYQDFNDKFLPHPERLSEKYQSVKRAIDAGIILPPIKVYQILDNYFVIDGHHRVTIAKNELNAPDIDAEVIKIGFDIELSSNKKFAYNTERAKDFLIKLQQEVFQRETLLKNSMLIYPLNVTDLTGYGKLLEEIEGFRNSFNDGEYAKKPIIYASHIWYETRFLPAVRIILEEEVLKDYPNRTYTDLYIWLQQHKYFLSQRAGYDVGFDFTATDFKKKKTKRHPVFDLLPPVVKDILRTIKAEIEKI